MSSLKASGSSWSRRRLCQAGLGLAAAPLAPLRGKAARADESAAHFFLHLCVSGGVDATYTFDARPLAFTDKGHLQNYGYKNAADGAVLLPDPVPREIVGANGTMTLRSPLTDPLSPLLPDLTIVNGVLMSPSLNGHGSNMYYMFSNSTGPGESFIPLIGAAGGLDLPLDSIHFGGFEGDGNTAPTNFAGSVQLQAGQGAGLANDLVAMRKTDFSSPVMRFVRERMVANAQGAGRFSEGARALTRSFERTEPLGTALVASGAVDPGADELMTTLAVAMGYFSGRVTRAVTLMVDRDPVIDVHSSQMAQQQVSLYTDIVAVLKNVLEKLKTTPFDADAGLSFLDVTTVLISSEFSRTMRSLSDAPPPVDMTGTDHNPLTNTVLLAGKGIKRGLVVGASDLSELEADGQIAGISGAHRALDPKIVQIMARPFDFTTGQPVSALPPVFRQEDYLSFPSLANTLMQLFGVPAAKHFRVGGRPAPILTQVLA